MTGEPPGEVLLHGGQAQEFERQLLAVPVHLELLLDGLQRMRRARHIRRPVRSQDQQTRRVPTPGQHAQQIDRGRVAPVQVFQYQHERRVTRHRLERLHQLPQHSLSRRALRAPLYRLHVVVRQQPRQLRQPCRRMLPEDLNQRFAPHPSPQTPERLEHRQVGLARAVLLHALAAADTERAALADLRQQRLHQRRLADPRLPCHEHQLPLPVERLIQPIPQPPQLRVSTHQRRRRGRGDRARRARFVSAGCEDRGTSSGQRPSSRARSAR